MRTRTLRSRAHLFFLLAPLALSPTGCDDEALPDSHSTPATPPLHPAMGDPTVKGGGARPASAPVLPPNHPPIDGSMAETPPVRPPEGGGGVGLAKALESYGLLLAAPKGWVEEPVASAAGGGIRRLGTFKLPHADGDAEDGELSVMPAAGGIEQNINRWRGQFTENPEAILKERKLEGINVTMVELDGTFSAGGGPMAKAGPPKPGTKLLGAIVRIESTGSLIFFKGWGPKATMEKWRSSFEELMGSFKPAR